MSYILKINQIFLFSELDCTYIYINKHTQNMKRSIIYEVALTGNQHNFYTLYRHAIGQMMVVSTFIQNLSINFDEACQKARKISGEDESTENYEKRLVTDSGEANEIIRLGTSKTQAELEGTLTFGKHKHEKLEEIFSTDHKYVLWIAKGGNVKSDEGDWYPTIEEDRPIRQQAIALLIGAGEWIERNGKFMPVERAQKLDYIDSLTPNPAMIDGKRVKELTVRLLSQPFLVQNDFGGEHVFKMVDENNHIYFGSSSNIDSSMLHIDDFTNTWFKIAFTPSLYEGKVYAKRIKMIVTPIDIKEGSIQIETSLYHKKDQENFSKAEAELLERISKAIDMREQINKTQLV